MMRASIFCYYITHLSSTLPARLARMAVARFEPHCLSQAINDFISTFCLSLLFLLYFFNRLSACPLWVLKRPRLASLQAIFLGSENSSICKDCNDNEFSPLSTPHHIDFRYRTIKSNDKLSISVGSGPRGNILTVCFNHISNDSNKKFYEVLLQM